MWPAAIRCPSSGNAGGMFATDADRCVDTRTVPGAYQASFVVLAIICNRRRPPNEWRGTMRPAVRAHQLFLASLPYWKLKGQRM